jgi:phosphopantothenoylcysteine decarboxylase/phosphopantothenate--cysteine ligase
LVGQQSFYIPLLRSLCFDRGYSSQKWFVMQDFINKKILLGVCGGIAAYKSAYLVRELTRLGAQVRVVMTQSAQSFITPLLMQALSGNEVRTELFDSQAERAMGHIELARWADYLVIAPASANSLAKMAHGIADDLLSTLYLVSEIPVIVCPAMNKSMWAHPATKANCKLMQERGVIFVGPEEGSQACGEFGLGRVSEAEDIISALRLHEIHQLLAGKSIVITAGPTREPIDPVRYLSNYSSGKMGFALAAAALMAGAKVTLISGPSALDAPIGIDLIRVESAQSMLDEVLKHVHNDSIFIGAAAVADYYVESPSLEKLKKKVTPEVRHTAPEVRHPERSEGSEIVPNPEDPSRKICAQDDVPGELQKKESMELKLIKNPDILNTVSEAGKASFVVGFAAETQDLLYYAQEKLKQKKLDMIIANLVGQGRGFENDMNEVTIITKKGQTALPLNHKTRLAGQIIAIIAATLQNDSQ